MAPPKKPAPPSPAPDLATALAGLGIDPSQLGAMTDTNDPPVYLGVLPPKRGNFGTGRSLPRTVKTTTSKAYAKFYKMEDDELLEFQNKAFAAGLYGTSDGTKVRFGDFDEDSFKLWRAVVDRAANFYQAGKKVTPMEALDMAIAARSAAGAEGEGRQGGGNLYFTTPSDPAALRLTADKLGQAILGRKPDKATRDRLVAAIMDEQRGFDAKKNAAAEGMSKRQFASESGYVGSQTVDVVAVDPEARLAEKIRAEYGVEAGAHSLAETGNQFFDLLNQVGG